MRRVARGATPLALGSALSGVLAYVFFALVTRALGAERAAPVSVLWTFWSLSGAALTFPLQHWVVREISASGHEGGVRRALGQVWAVVAVVALGCTLVAWPPRDALFQRDDWWFPVLVGVVAVGSAFVGLVRGVLTGRLRLMSVGLALAGENGLRCLVAAVLIGLGTDSPLAFGCTLAAGQLIGLCWPSALRLGREADRPPAGAWHEFVGAAAVGQLVSQVVLTGAPVVLALSGAASRDVTGVFAALALFRAPYTVTIGGISHLTGVLTRMAARRELESLARVRRGLVAATAAVALAAWAVGAWLGPWLVSLVFGADVRLDPEVAGLTAAGNGLALGCLVATVLVMALHRTPVMVWSWTAGLAVAAAVLVVLDAGTASGVGWAFVAAEATAFVMLVLGSARPQSVTSGRSVRA